MAVGKRTEESVERAQRAANARAKDPVSPSYRSVLAACVESSLPWLINLCTLRVRSRKFPQVLIRKAGYERMTGPSSGSLVFRFCGFD